MIICDYNGIAISAIFSQGSNPEKIEEGLVRHLILNSLRQYNMRFKGEYGAMVIACDGGDVWRKKYFPEYKANRKKSRDSSGLDWNEFFRVLNLVREEIRENLPYKVIHVQRAEADDVIASLVESTQEFGCSEKVMIVSSDKDFLQLQQYSNVRQFSPMVQKLIKVDDPIRELREKIFRGDSGDGVPNILSSDRALVEGIRQSPVTAKKVEAWLKDWDNLHKTMPQEWIRNFVRNQTLITLDMIPEDVKKEIIHTYKTAVPAPRSKILNYLISKKCAQLVSCANEFFDEQTQP